MPKVKESVEDFRNKLVERKKQEVEEVKQKVMEAGLENVVYDVIQDPDSTARSFLVAKIKYDLKTKQASVVEVRPFQDKAAGLSIIMDKENRKYLFERNKKGEVK